MKKLWLIGIVSFVIISAGLVSAQSPDRPFAHETVDVGLTPVILTAGTYGAFATSALLTIEGGIYYTLDGTTPTSTVGHRASGKLWLNMYQIRSIKMITTSRLATDVAEVQITYFKK